MDAFQAAGLIQETEEGFDGFTPRANGSDDSSSGSESTTARSARSKFSHEASIQSGNRQDDASDGEVTATAAMLISNDKRESESEEEQDGSDQEDLTRSGAECSAASSVVVPPLPPSRKMVTSVTKGKFPVSPHMEVVLREAFSCGIVSEQILEPLRKDTPLPDFDYLATPELDREVFEMEKKVAAKGCNNARINMFIEALLKEDTQRTAHIMGPLLLLLHHLKETDGKLELATIEDLLSRSIGECAQVLMHMRLQRQRNVLSGLKCLTVNTDSYLKAASPSVERKLDTVQLFGPDTFAQIVTQSNTFIKSLNAIGELAELNQPSKPSTGTYARRNGGGKMKQKFVRRDKNAGHHQFDRPTTSGQSQSGQSRKPTDKRPTETRSGSFNAELGLWLPVPSDVCPELRTGRTALFIDNWRRITNDPWVLNAVSGYCLEFDSSVLPTQLYAPPQINFSQTDFDMLDKEVSEMLAKGAVCEVLFMSDSFFSQLFLIPKKDGGSRPVINLKPLNRFIEYHHFKMEGMHSLHDILRQHDYMVKLDIKDAYFCIPIHPKHRRFLRFLWNGKAYEFTCLPFGLASAPRVFTKVLKPVVSFLRSRGMRGVIYIDDLLKLARSCEEAKVRLSGAIWLLEHLGFTINVKKSCFEPSQVMVFLGFVISSTTMEISIPSDKVQKIAEQCSSFLARNSVTLRELARLLGLLNSTSQAILPSSLYCRNLQLIHRDAAQMRQGWDEYTPLTSEAKEDITLWLRCINMWNGKPLKFPAPTLKITIDASLTGWGAICGSTSTHGIWSRSELQRSINYLELMAAYLGLKVFCSNLSSAHIRIISDNISAIAYINRQGGTHSRQLCHLAIDLWSWCLDRSLFVSAEHIPGVLNTEADLESRRHFESSDCSPQCPTTQVFFMETRSHGRTSGFSRPGLGANARLCVSAVQYDREGPPEGSGRQSNDFAFGANMVLTTMVPPSSRSIDRYTVSTASPRVPVDKPPRRTTSNDHRSFSSADCLSYLKRQWVANGFSDSAAELLFASWSDSTTKQYAHTLQKWLSWCQSKPFDPLSPPLNQVINYLAFLFSRGMAYRSINVHKSGLSAFLPSFDNHSLGTHPLVIRLMHGVARKNPPTPRYTQFWDVDRVLSTLLKLDQSSIPELTIKTAMLLALCSAARVSEIANFCLSLMSYRRDGLHFILPEMSKTSKAGCMEKRSFQITPYLENKSLCPVDCVRRYVEIVSPNRRQSNDDHLLISLSKPHKRVTSTTIARWLKRVLVLAGVDTSKFKAHSVRGAATSKAFSAGLTGGEILKAGRWSNLSTFTKHYCRTDATSQDFETAVLGFKRYIVNSRRM